MKGALVVVIVLLIAAVSCELQRVGLKTQRPPKNTMEVCRKDYRAFCLKQGPPVPGQRRNRRGPIDCLMNNTAQLKDPVCKSWVDAEISCRAGAQATGKCIKNVDVRRCLSIVSADALPADCTGSDFYKAVKSSTKSRVNKGSKGAPTPTPAQGSK